MRTIGVLGGITWHSAAEYYRLLNSLVARAAGRRSTPHAASSFSVDIGAIDPLLHAGRWDDAARLLARRRDTPSRLPVPTCSSSRATRCTHAWETIVAGLSIPTIHIADALADALAADRRERVALLGTTHTMAAAVHARAARRAWLST